MANYTQTNPYGQYFSFGSGLQYDVSQNKWVLGENTGNNETVSHQNQQDNYQAAAQAAEYYALAGYSSFGNQVYAGQQQSQCNSNTSVSGTSSSSNTPGNSTTSGTGSNTGGLGYGANYVNALNQIFAGTAGNLDQNSGTNTSNITSNQSGQNHGNNTGAIGQLSQMFGNWTNFGNSTSGGSTDINLGAGYNTFNSGMMSLLQQTLMQQANGAALPFGSNWGMPNGDGGYYAPSTDGSYQFGGTMGNASGKQEKKGKKWSGKDSNKQEFYGSRFAQMCGQSQSANGKVKRLQDGVRFNVKGEKVVDVEVPLTLYSRWGQLRKFFYKQDTEVVKHLLTFHDKSCEECMMREQHKKKGEEDTAAETDSNKKDESVKIIEESEEDMVLKEVMGFGCFNTPRGALVDGNNANARLSSTIAVQPSLQSSDTDFIGPAQPDETLEESQYASLSEEEKLLMQKLGWSVFNRQRKDEESKSDGVDDDDDKVDDGGKDMSAAEGDMKASENEET